MIRCILQRTDEYSNITKVSGGTVEDSTIGTFTVVDESTGETLFSCYTVENIGPSTDESGTDKRIVAREYGIKWKTTSVSLPSKYSGNGLVLYSTVLPEFVNRCIMIHVGNYPQDTEGCILLNKADNKNGTGGTSSACVEEFYDIVTEYGCENFIIDVREIGYEEKSEVVKEEVKVEKKNRGGGFFKFWR